MTVIIGLSPETDRMIAELRKLHIDANPHIQEELEQSLPPYIEDFVRGLYDEENK